MRNEVTLEWFAIIANRLTKTLRLSDWPEPGSESFDEFWKDFRFHVQRHEITAEIAELACTELAARPIRWSQDVRPEFIKIALDLKLGRRQATDSAATRERLRREEREADEERDRLIAVWVTLPESEQQALLADAVGRMPHMARWPQLLRLMCAKEVLRSREAVAADPAADDWQTIGDVIDRDEETDAQRARRMINETWSA